MRRLVLVSLVFGFLAAEGCDHGLNHDQPPTGITPYGATNKAGFVGVAANFPLPTSSDAGSSDASSETSDP